MQKNAGFETKFILGQTSHVYTLSKELKKEFNI